MLIVTPQIDWRRDGLPSSSSLLRGRGAGREEGWEGPGGGGGPLWEGRVGEDRGILGAFGFPSSCVFTGLETA